jgi:signal transduction histidine kinase
LHLVFTKRPLNELTLRVGMFCSVGGSLVALLILLWANRRIRSMTNPLRLLADAMEHQDTVGVRATVTGTVEVRKIATAFNRLMARVDEYTNGLERMVAERTAELRRATEAAQQAERYKARLMEGSTHEMKMPLHRIQLEVRRAMGELEFVDVDSDRVREILNGIMQAAGDLLSRILKILNAARTEGAQYEIADDDFSVPEFINALRERTEALARSQRNELIVAWRGASRARGDQEKLFEIALELLLNACKFTHGGVVRLELEVADTGFTIDVADTGCGIPEADQAQVWEEFHQGHGVQHPTYPGQGLGLSMVRQLVKLLGGTVTLTSSVGSGTQIRIVVPTAGQAQADTGLQYDQALITDGRSAQ